MDFLPRPADSRTSHLAVPFLDIIPYKFWHVAGFSISGVIPGAHEIKISSFIPSYNQSIFGLTRDRSALDCARLVQSWLYFGLIQECVGAEPSIDPSKFTYVTYDNKRLVTSTKLTNLISEITDPYSYTRMKQKPHRDSICSSARSYIAQISSIPCATQDPLPVALLSASVLLSSLDGNYPPYYVDHDCHYLEQDFPQTQLLARHMSSLGWCPRHISRICATQPPHIAYFISLLRRWERPRTSHSHYSEKRCVASNINEETYETVHTTRDCRCSMIGVDESDLERIIRQGNIPIVSVGIDQENNDITLNLRAATAPNQYAAISHVWADGIGNPQSNSLPRCQIERLFRQIFALPRVGSRGSLFYEQSSNNGSKADWARTILSSLQHTSRSFWIDTLCIPTGESRKDLRLDAINKMAAVYAGASHVLILYYELQQLRLRARPLMDSMGYIISCNWSSRSWTHQEGSLSNVCYFQFADGTFNPVSAHTLTPTRLHAMYRNVLKISKSISAKPDYEDHSPLDPVPEQFQRDLKRSLTQLLSSYEPKRRGRVRFSEESYYEALVGTWNTLIHRNPTKADELYLILCNLVDFNSYLVMKLNSNAILSSCPTIPLSFVFNRGPRYRETEHHPDRWLPVAVSGDYLSLKPSLTVHDRSLQTDSGDLQPMLLLPLIRLDGTHSIITKGNVFICNIEAHRCSGDRFQVDGGSHFAMCILLEKDINKFYGKIRGACVHITRRKCGRAGEVNFSEQISVIYDYPITATQLFRPELEVNSNRKVYLDRMVKEYDLEIERGPSPYQYALARRIIPSPVNRPIRWLPFYILYVVWIVCVIPATYILSPVHGFDPRIDLIILYTAFISTPLGEALFIYTITQLPHSPSNIASILLMCVKYITPAIYPIWCTILERSVYKSWVASFGEDWDKEQQSILEEGRKNRVLQLYKNLQARDDNRRREAV
ncbi:uncharacterized protein F4822DRAFT_407559 [Hypoxylon trugodes]|uniref:uncharacterized protein n=1 Tax=Hypoxylon trugodes TaxID=326681 RepID=UPI002197D138|nr:uncharacterized protein F4822DRAFT_407559 [Hypoxylon trugodes]KAI1387775.1 hypothetical protein F4822DRAFT_407559 [Hypoxylon trugodes]